MTWIFLSPHFDDVVLSCGGMIAEMVSHGQTVELWTICAGNPPPGPLSPLARSLHKRWGLKRNAAAIRRKEDRRSCAVLGVKVRHFHIPDCIYRKDPITGEFLILENEDLFQSLPEVEIPLAADLELHLARTLPIDARVVSPLTMGGHIDHHLVRRAAEALCRPLWYYADYPYAALSSNDQAKWILPDWETFELPVLRTSLLKWQEAIAEHESQISTFWGSLVEMQQSIEAYWQAGGGSKLWGNETKVIHNKTVN